MKPRYYLALQSMIAFEGVEGGKGSVVKSSRDTTGSIIIVSFVVPHKKLTHRNRPTADWWWNKEHLREITEEQALDPNFRKFMYKIYSGDPDGELDEIL